MKIIRTSDNPFRIYFLPPKLKVKRMCQETFTREELEAALNEGKNQLLERLWSEDDLNRNYTEEQLRGGNFKECLKVLKQKYFMAYIPPESILGKKRPGKKDDEPRVIVGITHDLLDG